MCRTATGHNFNKAMDAALMGMIKWLEANSIARPDAYGLRKCCHGLRQHLDNCEKNVQLPDAEEFVAGAEAPTVWLIFASASHAAPLSFL
jgi:hypothetical protein